MNNLIALIPAFNPNEALIKVVDELLLKDFLVIVINDGSSKATSKIFDLLPEEVTIITHEENLGKGSALKTGFRYIYTNFSSLEGVITLDADGQHTIEDIMKVASKLKYNRDSIILGSRSFTGKVPLKSSFGNSLTKIMFSLISKKSLKDTQTGLRGFNISMLPAMINIHGDRYEYETNLLLWAIKACINIIEVDIATVYLDKNKSSHFNPLKDSIKIYMSLFKFGLSSIFSFGIDIVLLFLFKYATSGLNPQLSLFISVVSARTFSSLFNYFINSSLVIKNTKPTIRSFIKYYTLILFILGCNYITISFLYTIARLPLLASKLLTEVILFFISYGVQKKLIFKNDLILKGKCHEK